MLVPVVAGSVTVTVGAGVRTAVHAGLFAWALAILLPNMFWSVTGVISRRLLLYSTLFGIVEIVVAAIVGGALYKEAESISATYPVAAETRQTMR